ncbi:MAG: hypothetical protein ACM3JD_10595 [Rudaea sp.]
MIAAYYFLLFFSIFVFIGGAGLGDVVRRVRSGGLSLSLIPALIRSILFGIVPLGMSLFAFSTLSAVHLVLVLLAVWLISIAVTAFVPEEYLSALRSGPPVSVGVGSFMLLLALALAFLLFEQDPRAALLIGGFMALFGIVPLAYGISELRKGNPGR